MKKLIIILLLAFSASMAQAQLEVNIGGGKTDLKKNAITIGLTYLRSFDSLYGNRTHFIAGKHSFFVVSPELNIRTGTEDAFSTLNLKATGLLCTFRTTTVGGLTTPEFDRTFHIFPMAAGIETNYLFNDFNVVLEAGWIPFYQSYGRATPDWLKKTNIGLFLQAGYKVSKSNAGIGGQENESLEPVHNTIMRVRGNAGIDTKELIKLNGLAIGLIGQADVWYDAINNATYDRVEARGRFYVNATQYIDFIYMHGSGAPLFNDADQFGVGVTLRFK